MILLIIQICYIFFSLTKTLVNWHLIINCIINIHVFVKKSFREIFFPVFNISKFNFYLFLKKTFGFKSFFHHKMRFNREKNMKIYRF